MINQEEFDRKIIDRCNAFHPVNATIEITNRCNASCEYCYIKHEPPTADLSLQDLRRVVDKLYEAGVLFLCITGGEPFLRSDITPFLEYCVKKDFFNISILTNGTLINDEHIALLSNNRDFFSYVKISLFSHIPEIHDAYCGIPGSFGNVIGKALKIQKSGVNVLISLNVLDFNCDTIEVSKKYFEDMGFSVWEGYLKLINSGDLRQAMKPLISRDFYTRCLRAMPKETVLAYQEGLKEKMADQNPITDLCIGLACAIHVGSSGDIFPCATFRKFNIGNILDGPSLPCLLRESKPYNHLKAMKKSDIADCNQCSYLNYCQPCLGLSHSEFGNFDHAPEQLCNFNKALHEIRYG